MEKVKAEVGFQGTLAEFFDHLRTDPQFFHKTPEELLHAYRAISKRIDPQLVKVFRTIPRLPYGVRPIPDNIAPDTTTAYYQPGAADGSRAGFYYVNLYKPEVRPTWEMMALSLHEAVPGPPLPVRPRRWNCRTRRCSAAPATSSPTARAGACTPSGSATTWACTTTRTTAWASWPTRCGARCGWSSTPACTPRAGPASRRSPSSWTTRPRPSQDIVNEIDRYIGWPGPGAGLQDRPAEDLRAARRGAKASWATRFDVREFHDAVLATGSVPLEALEAPYRRLDRRTRRANRPEMSPAAPRREAFGERFAPKPLNLP